MTKKEMISKISRIRNRNSELEIRWTGSVYNHITFLIEKYNKYSSDKINIKELEISDEERFDLRNLIFKIKDNTYIKGE